MFDIVIACALAWFENHRLANRLAGMTNRDFADIGISPSDAPEILRDNFKRAFVRILEARTETRGGPIRVLRDAHG